MFGALAQCCCLGTDDPHEQYYGGTKRPVCPWPEQEMLEKPSSKPLLIEHSRTTGSREKPVDTPKKPDRHLILNMDVNKTILMRDKVSSKGVKEIVNEVLADTVWGSATDGKWTPSVNIPSVHRPSIPGTEIVSFNEWLAEEFPGAKNKKLRGQRTSVFTNEGEPGAAFAEHAERLACNLKNPDGSPVQIIPAFFELLLNLKREKRSFTICFRTFGEDLGHVVEELNTFCEGNHPLFPGERMDGSDGGTDYRVTPDDPEKCGIFYRDEDTLALVMGTWQSPEREKKPSLSFFNTVPNATVTKCGLEEMHGFLREKFRRPGTMALRDYFPYWKTKEMHADGGKLHFYDLRLDAKEHWMFFDDNIRYSEAYIVDVQPASIDCKVPFVSSLLQSHIHRAEPLESILDKNYFVKHVAMLEAGYARKLKVRRKLYNLLRLFLFFSRARTPKVMTPPVTSLKKDYDAWAGVRHNDRELSICFAEDIHI